MNTTELARFFSRSAPRIPLPKGTIYKKPVVIRTTTIRPFTIRGSWKSSNTATIALYAATGATSIEIAKLRLQGVDQREFDGEFESLLNIIKGGGKA